MKMIEANGDNPINPDKVPQKYITVWRKFLRDKRNGAKRK